MRLLFPYNHAFLNGRVAVDDDGATEPGRLVEFSAGTTALSMWHRDKENITLDVPAYRTPKGPRVSARRGDWCAARMVSGEPSGRREPPQTLTGNKICAGHF